MVALSRPRSARRAGQGNVSAAKATASSSGAAGAVAVSLRTSKSQPNALTSSSHVVRGQPASAGGKAVPYAGGTYGVDRSMTTAGKQAGKDKVLNWFRLPNGEGWVPAARTVSFHSRSFCVCPARGALSDAEHLIEVLITQRTALRPFSVKLSAKLGASWCAPCTSWSKRFWSDDFTGTRSRGMATNHG